MAGGIWELPIAFEVLDAATVRCLPGFAPGFIDFEKDLTHSVLGGMSVYKLRQGELGDMGTARVEKRRAEESQICFSEPSGVTDDEAMDYAELLNPEAANKVEQFAKKIAERPTAIVRAMIGFDIASAEALTFEPPSAKSPTGKWLLGESAPPLHEAWQAANKKIKEWREVLDQRRDEHFRNVITAFFNRLRAEDIWPKQLLFSAKCASPDRLQETLKTLVLKHLPAGATNRPFFSGSVEEVSLLPRKFLVLADSHGAGRLVVGYVEFSPFPDSKGEYEVVCSGNNVPGLIRTVKGLFEELANILQQAGRGTGQPAVAPTIVQPEERIRASNKPIDWPQDWKVISSDAPMSASIVQTTSGAIFRALPPPEELLSGSEDRLNPTNIILLATVTKAEAQAVLEIFPSASGQTPERRVIKGKTYYPLGPVGGADVFMVQSEMGAATPGGALITIRNAIDALRPVAIIMVGIAFGINSDKQKLGDVLVSRQLAAYEPQKVKGHKHIPRGDRVTASTRLLDKFRAGDLTWHGAHVHFGLIVSGEKLVNDKEFRDTLLAHEPEAIGGEMEGAGLYAAAEDAGVAWIVVKAICDWADGNKSDENQAVAARNATSFVRHVLQQGGVSISIEPPRPVKISTAKLPPTRPDLFGREKELAALDAAWENQGIHILSLVAWGGVGKTALVNKWLLQIAQDNYRGAECVYGWSFYSQGAAEGRQISADQFILAALDWFDDPDPIPGSPWARGERLAELVKQRRTLLILDGLEPLQNPPPTGRIKDTDPGLSSLLRELARQNPGLVIITTRWAVDDLKDFVGSSAIEMNLENLPIDDGAKYLVHLGVKGTNKELKRAAAEFGTHALALTLLGSYLTVVYHGDVRQRHKIARLTDEKRQGTHARRVMESYERWFDGKPELDILRLMGLFDRPAEGGAIEALKDKPVIQYLTSNLQGLSYADWQYAVDNLRVTRLLSVPDPNEPDTLDCHPLLREHFGDKLRVALPQAWQEAHSRLYEYYKSRVQEYPDAIEDMTHLYAAVAHGCQAGRHQEVYDEVYRRRIHREDEFYTTYKLGAFGAELSAVSNFFDVAWSLPAAGLLDLSKAFVLKHAGYCLRALGRPLESIKLLEVALELHQMHHNWKDAAIDAGILSHTYLNVGNLNRAKLYADEGVKLADLSGDPVQRVGNRITLLDALHQMGYFEDAMTILSKAEELAPIQGAQQPRPFLHSVEVYRCCDLLLSMQDYKRVQDWAAQDFKVAKQKEIPLDIALNLLLFGRTQLDQGKTSNPTEVAINLEESIEKLRQAGQQNHLPRGLLARAELYRVTGALGQAQTDLEEALFLVIRGGMRLFEVDCYLGFARLYMNMGDKTKARERVKTTQKMIQQMGYHRRDKDLRELEAQLDL